MRRRLGDLIRILLIIWRHPALAKENDMPQVGKKKYPYTEAGMKAAKMDAKKSGKKMVASKKKKMK